MLKWLFTLIVVLLLLGLLGPLLARMGVGRLPGDLQWRHRGRMFYFPLASSIIFSLAITLMFRVLRV